MCRQTEWHPFCGVSRGTQILRADFNRETAQQAANWGSTVRSRRAHVIPASSILHSTSTLCDAGPMVAITAPANNSDISTSDA